MKHLYIIVLLLALIEKKALELSGEYFTLSSDKILLITIEVLTLTGDSTLLNFPNTGLLGAAQAILGRISKYVFKAFTLLLQTQCRYK